MVSFVGHDVKVKGLFWKVVSDVAHCGESAMVEGAKRGMFAGE
jgi:hypothetical protein